MSATLPSDEARTNLHRLLWKEARQLRMLGPEPVMVASALDKFNDAGYDDYWCAVQIGSDHWEQSQFFASDGRRAFAQDRAKFSEEANGKNAGTSLMVSRAIREGRLILDRLDKGDWRTLASVAFSKDPVIQTILSLIIQFDQPWLWINDPMNGGMLYSIDRHDIRRFADEGGRLDELVGFPNLIQPIFLDVTTLPFLSPEAKHQFAPAIVDQSAAKQLVNAVIPLANTIRTMTPHPVVIAAGGERGDDGKYVYPRSMIFRGPDVIIKGQCYNDRAINDMAIWRKNAAAWEQAVPGSQKNKPDPFVARFGFADFEAIHKIAVEFDALKWRRLFERATGVNTFDREPLKLIIARDRILVTSTAAIFVIERSSIALLGYPKGPARNESEEQYVERLIALDLAIIEPAIGN